MKENQIVSIFPMPDSILLPKTKIQITYKKKISKDGFRHVVGLDNYTSAKISLSRNQKTITIENILTKMRQLKIILEPLLSSDRKYISKAMTLNFNKLDIDAPKLKRGFSLLQTRKVKLELLGVKGQIFKIENEQGSHKTVFLESDGKELDYQEVILKEAQLYRKKFGKLHPLLFNILEETKENESIEVELWLLDRRKDFDKSRYSFEELEKQQERVLSKLKKNREYYMSTVEQLSKEYKFEVVKMRRSLPSVVIKAAKRQLQRLLENKKIQFAFPVDRKYIDDLSNALQISSADYVQNNYGLSGDGVRVAVYEASPADTSNLNIVDFYDNTPSSSSNHATNVTAIIQNTQSGNPNGFAPKCSMYSANDYDIDAIEWAVLDKRCSIINQSFHTSSEPHSADLTREDKIKDYLAYHYPYPTIIHAAGNFWNGDPDNVIPPSSEYVNHKGFNTISIGNHNDTASAMSSSSVFRNPDSPHNDRELPELSANGTGLSLLGSSAGSGTSYASPAVVGSVALLQEANNILKYWPEGIRAILFAGAIRNVDSGTWWNDVITNIDAKDGAGAMNVLESVKIINQRKFRNNVASNRGWDIGSLTDVDFNASELTTFEYRIKVPTSIFSFITRRKVKVTLAWSNKVIKFLSWYFESKVNVDLDLRIYNSSGNLVALSQSWDNSYEIAEFEGNVGEEYTIKIKRWSGDDRTYYGIAWTAGEGFSFKPPISIGRIPSVAAFDI